MRVKPRILMLVVAAAAVALALASYAFDSRSDQEASQRHLQELQANIDELRTELRRRPALVHDTEAARTRGVASLARREARAETQRVLDDNAATDEASSAKPVPVSLEESRAAVVEAFGQEGSDPHWSASAAHKLETSIRDRLPKGSRLGSVECHTTMCRVEVLHTEPGEAQAFLMNAFRDWPGSLFVAEERQERSERVVTIIASREGHEPPLAPR